MRAVNLIPDDSRRGWGGSGGRSGGSVYVLLGTLAVALALVTVYVLTTNQISDQKAKVAALQAEAATAQGTAAQLSPYVEFAKLAQARTGTVRAIASSRFDWHAALAGLSRVVPANTSLQSLVATVAPGVGVGGAGGSGADLRGAIAAPAFQISGCSDSQVDVARLISRLKVINGVTRVSLEDSQKSGSSQPGAAVSSAAGGSGCRAGAPTFDLVVFFTPLANAGVTSVGTQPVSSTTATPPATSTTATSTTATGGSK
jgi:Tfp pilus assembly protein PilN